MSKGFIVLVLIIWKLLFLTRVMTGILTWQFLLDFKTSCLSDEMCECLRSLSFVYSNIRELLVWKPSASWSGALVRTPGERRRCTQQSHAVASRGDRRHGWPHSPGCRRAQTRINISVLCSAHSQPQRCCLARTWQPRRAPRTGGSARSGPAGPREARPPQGAVPLAAGGVALHVPALLPLHWLWAVGALHGSAPRARWPVLRCGAVSGRRRGAVQEPESGQKRGSAGGRSRAQAASPLRCRLAERGEANRPAGRAAPARCSLPPRSREPLPARVCRVQHEVRRWPGEVRRRWGRWKTWRWTPGMVVRRTLCAPPTCRCAARIRTPRTPMEEAAGRT